MLLTLPIIYPLLITQMKFDPIWFGVILTILIEVAQVTPPVGFNLFGAPAHFRLADRPVARSALPFAGLLMLGVVLLYLFPQIALFLPSRMIY